jgi:uncharacterized membrane protein (UPF0127 family)
MSRWRPHTTGILIGGLVLILVALAVSYILTNFQPTTQLRLGANVFSVRLATTEDAREQGLSGVKKLDANAGLLMAFARDGEWSIWMKDMNIPIDILWLDSGKKVIYIVTDASPTLSTSKKFVPKTPARYVLEVAAGTVKNSAIKIGDVATFDINEDLIQ